MSNTAGLMQQAGGVAHWFGTQLAAMKNVIDGLITGGSMPVRQTLLYTIVMIIIAFMIVKSLTRKAKKP
jgi:hypothetical protein